MWEEEETRKPIPMSVKKEVYKRAKGRCEKCHTPWKWENGNFHHLRTPTITPTAKTVVFLCPNCHTKYGHKRITRRYEDLLGTHSYTQVIRQRVVRKPKSKTRRIAIRSLLGEVIGYRTIKIRKKKRKVKQKGKVVKRKAKKMKRRRRRR